MSNFVLQNIIFPSVEINAPEDMYYRADHRVSRRFSEKFIQLEKGAITTFDTFFNSISVGVWKSNTSVSNLSLILNGFGDVIIRFGLHRIGHAHKWLSENQVTLTQDGTVIDMPFWEKLEDGMLYFQIEAFSESVTLTGGTFVTNDAPITNVKLGVVITHFNRKQYVVPAIQRIESQLLNDPRYEGKIDLVVVDNSKNITQEEAGIKPIIIPNKNLGGSGGFTRGLLYLEDQKEYTHCLFMDDDASCEVESLRRTFAFLSFSNKSNIAIAGSMLRDIEPYRLSEKGAIFNGVCNPIHANKDMRSIHDLLFSELKDQTPNYGGWWFFAFAISDVKHYPYPFFVRGDDSMFSMVNKFDIITMNGISCWGDDFALKSSPLTYYLDTRYHLLHSMLLLNKSPLFVAKLAFSFSLMNIFSYNYDSAKSVIKAINDVCDGPEFWINNIDMAEIRTLISSYGSNEKLIKNEREKFNVTYSNGHESLTTKILRYVTLNGLLMPSIGMKKIVTFQHKGFRARLREVFRSESILYEYEPLSLSYKVSFSRKKSFILLKDTVFALCKLVTNFSRIKNSYLSKYALMTSKVFWEDVYSSKD